MTSARALGSISGSAHVLASRDVPLAEVVRAAVEGYFEGLPPEACVTGAAVHEAQLELWRCYHQGEENREKQRAEESLN